MEGIPDIYTWISGVIVISGVGFIVYGEHLRDHETKHNQDNNNKINVKSFDENDDNENDNETDNESMITEDDDIESKIPEIEMISLSETIY